MTEITDLTALDLSAKIEQGTLRAVDVMAAFLDRIEAINPQLNAIVSLKPRDVLMAEAKHADDTPRKGWLHGIPMAIKDLAETQGLRTTFGSPLFADYVPSSDCLMVERLKDDGAIIIGKTNTPEFGLGSHTFNPVHGPTRNPYDTTRTPGGSSGGAACALAARLLPIADGSDMMGSLRNPAAFCNTYGFRPTWGLVPDEPAGEMYFQQLATSGPMGRSPADIAALLETMSGPDARLPYAVETDPGIRHLDGPVEGKRIGWLGDWGGTYRMETGIAPLCARAVEQFASLGCRVDTLDAPFDAERLWHAWITLRAWANAARMAPVYNDEKNRALLKPAAIWEIERGLNLSASDIYEASLIRSDWLRCVNILFERYDALALPSAQVWPFPIEQIYPKQINGHNMDSYHRWMEIVVPVSLIGLPSLALPAGFGETGLPMGFQLFGKLRADREILTLGHAYHQLHDWTAHAPDLD